MSESGSVRQNSIAKTILVVDDDSDIVLALEVMLQDAGYQVVSASNGDSLHDLILRGDLPDLILLDMLLSGRDGREIARQPNAQESTQRIPILMLSAHPAAEHEAKHEAKAVGADGFVAKPFEIDDLLAAVQTIIGMPAVARVILSFCSICHPDFS
jgi:CheY-like chemotaxis protein